MIFRVCFEIKGELSLIIMHIKPIHYTKDLSTIQLRAARYAIGLRILDIRNDLNISSRTLSKVESLNNMGSPEHVSLKTISKLRNYYEEKGIIFLEQNGILFDPINDDNFLDVLNANLEKYSINDQEFSSSKKL